MLRVDLADAKKRLSARNKQLHQLWYRSVTLRHIISLLDQIEGIAKVPARIEKLIAEKQFYAAVQVHVQSALMLEREGLQNVCFLHLTDEYSKPLIWNTRVKIALGTARALEYLHEVCSPTIVHKNIKSAKILLDNELNPNLSDSGLASFITNADQAARQAENIGGQDDYMS